MGMWTDLGLLLFGGACLYFGAEWLVAGSSGLAKLAGVRPLVIGLTVVAYGTSAPELVVSVLAALEGEPAIALGNVVGSNIANLGLILGVTALIAPPKVNGKLIRLEIPVMVLASLLVPLLLWNGILTRLEGGILVLLAVAFTVWVVRAGLTTGTAEPALEESAEEHTAKPRSGPWLGVLTVGGLAVLVLGGRLFVVGSTGIAEALGISPRVIGLTIVAVGTSLPELATSLVAAFRGHSDIAVGNVVGSNIFNVLLVLGGAAAIHPLGQSVETMRLDLGVLLAITLVGAVGMRSERFLTRAEGALLLAGYGAFIAALVVLG